MEVRRACMRAHIRQELVKRILDGTYKPGDRLVELQIAKEFRTSQGPVREALRELEALRLVKSETYRGTRVRSIGEREMREVAEVRGMLESEAAKIAAVALKADPAPIYAALEAIRTAARDRDLDGYARSNMEFHRLVVSSAGNSVLLRLWDSLMLEVRTRIGLTQLSLDLVQVAECHAPIVDALVRGDGEEASRLVRAHAVKYCWWDRNSRADAAEGLLATGDDLHETAASF